ncbi:reticulocyte binding protein 2b [Plasmodium gonderi]|uniref:Reticulocyte binding protein 2b n=1 Tax=Plasmodium gonderi TaxID=77519 RepID=A0A1Y1JFK6_PLAGO|nr:reticulocyte binding protein 2b [Plasmodium gonderi]GAW80438.1 reticulocyte binding protein 2b [Plasmodium gonderi]
MQVRILYKILFNLLFALLGNIKEKTYIKMCTNRYLHGYIIDSNGRKFNRSKKKLNLTPLYEKSIQSNESQYGSEEQEYNKNKDDNKFNVEHDKNEYSSSSSSLVAPENYTSDSTKPLHFSYINSEDTGTNKKLNINKTLNTIKSSFIQNNKRTVKPGKVTQNTTPNKEVYVMTDNLDYVDAPDFSGYYLISQISPHYAYMNFFDEFRRISVEHGSIRNKYNKMYAEQVLPLLREIDQKFNFCEKHKYQLKVIVHIFESPNLIKERNKKHDEKFTEYIDAKKKYLDCIVGENKYNEMKISVMKLTVYKMLKEAIHHQVYKYKVYTDMIAVYLVGLKNMPYDAIRNYINEFKDFYNSSSNVVQRLEKEVNNKDTIYSIKFIRKEMEYIIDRFTYHMEKVNYSMNYIKEFSTVGSLKIDSQRFLEEYYYNAACNYSIFRLSSEHLQSLRSALIDKRYKMYVLFSTLIGDLEKKINKLMSSIGFFSESNKILAQSVQILKRGEEVYNKNEKILETFALYNSVEVNKLKKECDIKMNSLKDCINSIGTYNIFIKNAYNKNLLEESSLKRKKYSIPYDTDPYEKTVSFLNLLDNIEYSKVSVDKNFDQMKKNFEEIQKLKDKIEEFALSINDDVKELEDLVEKEKENKLLKEEISPKMNYIKEKIEKIKEIIHIEKSVETESQLIDKLISDAEFKGDEFKNKKTGLYNKIKDIINKFHTSDLQKIVEDMTNFLESKENLLKNTNNKREIEELLRKTNENHNKLKEMNCDDISKVIENLKVEVEKFMELKNEIANKKLENMRSEMSIMLDQLKKEYEYLKTKLSNYEGEKNKLDNNKENIIIIKNKIADNEHEYDKAVSEGISIYNDFIQNKKNILEKETEISNEISTLNEKIRIAKTTLEKYDNAIQNLETNAKKTDSHTEELLEKIKTEINELKLNEDESKFDTTKGNVNNTIKEIENANINIETLKRLKTITELSTVNKKSIEEVIKNKGHLLKEKIEKHIQKMKEEELIEQSAKSNLLSNIDNEKKFINEQLNDIHLNEIKTQIEKTLRYCEDSRKSIKNNNEINLEELNINEIQCGNMKGKIETLNSNFQELNKKIDNVINKHHNEIIKLIDRHITEKGKNIENKAEEHIHALEKAKERLSSFETNEDVTKYDNRINKQELSKLMDSIQQKMNKINESNTKLINIKQKTTEYMAQSNKVKNKQSQMNEMKDNEIIFNQNRNEIKDIYTNMNNTYNELDSIEKLETTSLDIDNLEIQQNRLLITTGVQKLDDEHAKTKETIEKIKTFMKSIETLRSELPEETGNDIAHLKYSKHETENIINNKKINEIIQKAKEIKQKASTSTNLNEVKTFKDEVNKHIEQVLDEYNSMQNALKDIEHMQDLLRSTNSNVIAEGISKKTKEADTFKKQAQSELEKMSTINEGIKKKIDQAREHQSKVQISLDDKEIDEKVNQIEKINKEVINMENKISEHLRKIKEYKENCLSEVHNAERAKIKIDSLQKKDGNTGLKDFDVKNVENDIANCKIYKEQVQKAETDAEQMYKIFSNYLDEISDVLKKSLILGVETKSKKRKNDAAKIMDEIKKECSSIKIELQESLNKLNEMNKKHTISVIEDTLDNKKSADANVSIQQSLENVKQNLLQVNNVSKEVEAILTTANNSFDLMSKVPDSKEKTELETLEKESAEYVTHLEKLNEQKRLVMEKRKTVDEIKSDIINIETNLKKNSKNFEIGLLNKINEIAKIRKSYVDSAEQLLATSMSNFVSLFIGFDLKRYNIGTNIDNYKRNIKELLNEFQKSYELIQDKEKNALEDSVDSGKAKELRVEAQNEEKKLENIEKRTKMYLNDIDKMESFKLIHDMKENINHINKMCKDEYTEVNEGHGNLEKIIKDIKNLNDGSDSSIKLQQAEHKNNEIKTKTSHYSYKIEAHNILEQIAKSAKFIGISITTELQSSKLAAKAHLQSTSELQFQSKDEIKLESEEFLGNENKLDFHKNIQDAYKSVLQIYKYSDDIIKKQEECEKLMKEGKKINFNIKSINDLKSTIENIKSKESTITSQINDAFAKLDQLNKISCSDENSVNILEKSHAEELKKKRDAFNQEKVAYAGESKLNECKGLLASQLELLNDLKITTNTMKADETLQESIGDRNSSIFQISTIFEDIEKKVTGINNSFYELLLKGKICETFKYTSIKDSLNAKINAYSTFINNKKGKVAEYLAYIQSNYNSIFQDIDVLNQNLVEKSTTTYAITKMKEANALSAQLTNTSNEYDAIVNTIKKEYIDANEKTEIVDLENSAKKLKDYFVNINNKKNAINELHNKIKLIKFQEMRTTSDKYLDIAKRFTYVVDDQKKRLSEIHNKQITLKNNLKDKEENLIQVDNTFTLESIKSFDELYDKIKSNIDELNILEQNNVNELKKSKSYEENILYLLTRMSNLKEYAHKYETKDKLKDENNEIKSAVDNEMRQNDEILKNLEEELKKLLKSIKENENLCTTNNTKDFVSHILKKIDIIRENFTKNLPEKEKVFQIESKYNEIKSIYNEIYADANVKEFTENITKNVQNKFTSVRDSKEAQKIKEAIDDITNNYTQIKSKLSSFINALDKIKIKKNDMNALFGSLSKERVNNYNTLQSFINDSDRMTNQLEEHISEMSKIIKDTENIIKELEEKQDNILNPRVINKLVGGQNKLLSDAQQQGSDKINTKEQNLTQEQGHSNNGGNTLFSANIMSQDGQEKTQNKYHYKIGGDNQNIRYAGAILALSICYGVFYILNNRDEKDKNDTDVFDDQFEGCDAFNLDDKEEVIDVCFNDAYYSD